MPTATKKPARRVAKPSPAQAGAASETPPHRKKAKPVRVSFGANGVRRQAHFFGFRAKAENVPNLAPEAALPPAKRRPRQRRLESLKLKSSDIAHLKLNTFNNILCMWPQPHPIILGAQFGNVWRHGFDPQAAPSSGRNQTQARLRGSPRKPYPETRPMKKHSASSTADRDPATLQFSGALIKTLEPKVEGPDFPKAGRRSSRACKRDKFFQISLASGARIG